jgi:hypothetical protein
VVSVTNLYGRNLGFLDRNNNNNNNNTSVASVCDRTIPTERPPLVGEVNANFYGQGGFAWAARRIPTAIISDF